MIRPWILILLFTGTICVLTNTKVWSQSPYFDVERRSFGGDTFSPGIGQQWHLGENDRSHNQLNTSGRRIQGVPNETGTPGWFDELTFFAGIDGAKQPQDFGVNALLGGQASMNWGLPLLPDWGVGLQLGTGVTAAANAVQVFDLLGETRGRLQSFTTVGLFQRTTGGFSWGFAHDFLYQDYFDNFSLSQWRMRTAYLINPSNEIGATVALRGRQDTGLFAGAVPVTLRSIDQGQLFWRRFWESGAQTTFWIGLADGHGENNAVTGPAPRKGEQFLFGADLLMPLTASLALYGEANMIMPADTGTVDAFLGIQWSPRGRSYQARRGCFSPLLPLAAPTSFAVDLLQ